MGTGDKKSIRRAIVGIAEDAANSLTSAYIKEGGHYPLDLLSVYSLLGIKGRAQSVSWLRTGGFIDIGKKEPSIYYSANDSRCRARFTVAHELGHWIIRHQPAITQDLCSLCIYDDASEEIFCDAFATSVLMPKHPFFDCFSAVTGVQSETLFPWANAILDLGGLVKVAKAFGVSLESCIYRFKSLDLLRDSRMLLFSARESEHIIRGGDRKLRIMATCYDSASLYMPRNIGLNSIGWMGSISSLTTSYYLNNNSEEVIWLWRKVGSKYLKMQAIARGSYLSWGVQNKTITGCYQIDHSEVVSA